MTGLEKAQKHQALRALHRLGISNPQIRGTRKPGVLFELMIITGLAAELQHQGHTVTVVGPNGGPLRPGNRVTASSNPHPLGRSQASAYKVEANGNEWLLVQGVQFRGRSHVDHEVDVAMIPMEALKHAPVVYGRPIISIESKDVAGGGALSEVRSQVGVLYDLTNLYLPPNRWCMETSQQVHDLLYPPGAKTDPPHNHRDRNQILFNAIVRSGDASSSAKDLASHYGIVPFVNFRPSNMQDLRSDVARWAAQKL